MEYYSCPDGRRMAAAITECTAQLVQLEEGIKIRRCSRASQTAIAANSSAIQTAASEQATVEGNFSARLSSKRPFWPR